LKTVLLEIHT